MSAWLMKARRIQSRHSKDARNYGHTTTAMQNLSTPPPLPPKIIVLLEHGVMLAPACSIRYHTTYPLEYFVELSAYTFSLQNE